MSKIILPALILCSTLNNRVKRGHGVSQRKPFISTVSFVHKYLHKSICTLHPFTKAEVWHGIDKRSCAATYVLCGLECLRFCSLLFFCHPAHFFGKGLELLVSSVFHHCNQASLNGCFTCPFHDSFTHNKSS